MERSERKTKRDTVIEVWTRLGGAAVGEQVLRKIQRVIGQEFGGKDVDSPAAIARILADAGADLLHPEVIEFDARWREQQLQATNSGLMDEPDLEQPLTLMTAAAIISRLEKQRFDLLRESGRDALRELRELAQNEKARAQLLAHDDTLTESTRAAQMEIAEWLRVWLSTPDIFAEWLELRRRSDDFRKQFPED